MVVCQSCGVEAPTKYVEFYQNIGALFMRFSKSIKAILCKNCINQYFWSFTGITLVLGWWGIISFFVTPFILLNNIVQYLGSLGLDPPAVASIFAVKMKDEKNNAAIQAECRSCGDLADTAKGWTGPNFSFICQECIEIALCLLEEYRNKNN